MAADKLFFHKLAEVDPRFRTPALAITALGVWSAFLACLGRFEELVNYTMFVAWIFYGLGAASIFAYRRRHRELPRPYLVPLYPWTPLLFVLAAAALVLNVIVSTPRNAAIGLGILAIGLPAYLLWRKPGAEPFEAASIQPTEEL
jgi:APA family basic amino acid/polyamine antiporter